jgi:hypothetical protein
MLCGGGSAVWSVDALLQKTDTPRRESKLLPSLVLFQILIAVFFAGVEKILAGWPRENEMGILLSYPRGFLVRDWVANSAWLHGPAISSGFTWLTLFVELGAPIFLLRKRTRVIALLVYEAFFIGIVAMLEVPALFYFMFAFGAILALDAAEVTWVLQKLRTRRATTATA